MPTTEKISHFKEKVWQLLYDDCPVGNSRQDFADALEEIAIDVRGFRDEPKSKKTDYTIQFISPTGEELGSFHLPNWRTQRVLGIISSIHRGDEDHVNQLVNPPSEEEIKRSKEAGKLAEKAEAIITLIET